MKKGSSPARRDVKREASVSSNDESSGEDYSQKEDGLKKIEAIAAGAEFLGLDDVSTMGQIAPEPVKSLIVKLPAKKTIKPGNRLEDASRKMASRK